MSLRDPAAPTEGERGPAVGRLESAVSLRSRLRAEREAATDTPREVTADTALRLAEDQVAARERWLQSVDDHNY
jgi:hypothetical protein